MPEQLQKFNDKELQLDNYLIKLRTFLDKRKYSKLSDSEQQRIINYFNKIDNIMENKKQVRLIHIPENISNESVYLCFVIKL